MLKLYVGNISFNATQEDIVNFLSPVGTAENVNIIKDKFNGKAKGFAFIEMEDEAAKKAIEELNGKEFLGRKTVVAEANPIKERVPGERRPYRGGHGDRDSRPRHDHHRE